MKKIITRIALTVTLFVAFLGFGVMASAATVSTGTTGTGATVTTVGSSVELFTPAGSTGSAYIRLSIPGGIPLNTISSLHYNAKVTTPGTGGYAPEVILNIDANGDNVLNGTGIDWMQSGHLSTALNGDNFLSGDENPSTKGIADSSFVTMDALSGYSYWDADITGTTFGTLPYSPFASAITSLPLDGITATTKVYSIDFVVGTSGNFDGMKAQFSSVELNGTTYLLGDLHAEDFGVVNYDTGLGFLKGYTAGFGLTDATLAGATSVVVKLYAAGDVLLQTNTAILPKFNTDITGTQFSSPFDVSGNFDYATDGYWTNVRETQFGQSVPAVKVVATVTLANGKVVTAENTLLTGPDPSTIYPPACNATATADIFSDTTTYDFTDGHGAVAVTPHPAWATIAGATWIYSDPLDVNGSSPIGTKTFTKTFNIVGTPLDSSLQIAADNMYTVSVNGHALATGTSGTDLNNFSSPQTWTIPAADLLSGSNTITFTVTNPGVDPNTQVPFGDPNPAGLLYKLTINNNECVTPAPKGHIIVDKVTDPAADPQNFDFTTTGTGYSPFSLTDLATPNDQALDAGTYTVAETPVNGWTLASVKCVYGDSETIGTPVTNGEQIILAAGQTATCTFTNTKNAVMPQVHIFKYVDGAQATVGNTGGATFPMETTFNSPNLGSVANVPFTLSPIGWGPTDSAYEASFVGSNAGADYEADEVLNSAVVGGSCDGTHTFSLVGYTTGETLLDAQGGTPNLTAPSFTNLQSDKYVIVWNITCPTTGTLTVEKNTIGKDGTFTLVSDLPGGSSISITTTGNTGSQTFTNLTPGTYHVTEPTTPKGWTMTDNECSAVTISAGDNITCTVTNTSNKLLGQIRGTKFEDKNGNGKKDFNDKGLAGWTIYLDKNTNGVLDAGDISTVTDARGNYRFTNLSAGTYVVREVNQLGWLQTYPSGGSYTIVLAAGKVSKKDNFGNFEFGTISGMKYNDANGNGRKDNGEVGLPNWTINLAGPNSFASTTITDANGNYFFGPLNAGMYTLSEVMQPTWRQTDHPNMIKIQSGTDYTKALFGNTTLPPKVFGHGDDHDFPFGPFGFNFPNNFGHGDR